MAEFLKQEKRTQELPGWLDNTRIENEFNWNSVLYVFFILLGSFYKKIRMAIDTVFDLLLLPRLVVF